MFFVIVLLLGFVNEFNAMEAINSNQMPVGYSADPFIPVNSSINPFISDPVPLYPTPIPFASAPCNQCIDNQQILKILKIHKVVLPNFEWDSDLAQAIEEQKRACDSMRENEHITYLAEQISQLDIVVCNRDLLEKITNILNNTVGSDTKAVTSFVMECISELVKPEYQPKLKPWTRSENLNNAFRLIMYDGKELMVLGITALFFPILFAPLFVFNAKSTIVSMYCTIVPMYCVYKGLLKHADEKVCPCHKKPNETFKCVYRLTFLGIGLALFFVYWLPRFFYHGMDFLFKVH